MPPQTQGERGFFFPAFSNGCFWVLKVHCSHCVFIFLQLVDKHKWAEMGSEGHRLSFGSSAHVTCISLMAHLRMSGGCKGCMKLLMSTNWFTVNKCTQEGVVSEDCFPRPSRARREDRSFKPGTTQAFWMAKACCAACIHSLRGGDYRRISAVLMHSC